MKLFFKVILIVVIAIIVLGIAQTLLNFSLIDLAEKYLGGTKLKAVRVNLSQEIVTPKFEIVSLEVFYPQNLSVIEADKSEWWRLNIGTVFIFVEYDTYLKFGVRHPDSIKVERDGDIVYVDEDSIEIELLDTKLNNFHHIRTFTSNPLVQNRDAEKFIFESLNRMEEELRLKIQENGRANFEYAKKNFMENYKNLCKAMGLDVVWR